MALDRKFVVPEPVGMTLSQYRSEHGVTLEALAARVGISKNFLCEIEKGAGCSLQTALRIELVTQGAVRPADLVQLAQSPLSETEGAA